jgi:3',5'-nucleoside bisphosphate phosphatase
LKEFRADLHIHSCLSPCGDLDMSPRAIVQHSLAKGVEIIAVCDHNSAENVGAVLRAGVQQGVRVLPGMEISSAEEVHTLAIFETESQALAMQELVYRHLRGTNRPEIFGDQVVANEWDEVEGFNDRLLIGATQMALHDVVKEVHRLGGISIASHVNRESFSLLSQLGFVPPGLELDAVEVSRHLKRGSAASELPAIAGFPVVSFSDAHFPEEIGNPSTSFWLDSPSLDEIRMALGGQAGRRVLDP